MQLWQRAIQVMCMHMCMHRALHWSLAAAVYHTHIKYTRMSDGPHDSIAIVMSAADWKNWPGD